MRIAITGSSGFIGRALVKELLKLNHEVCVLIRTNNQLFVHGVTPFQYTSSFFDCKEDLKKWQADIFFHLAWRGVDSLHRNSKKNIDYNIALTLDTVKLAYEIGCSQWIGMGSQAEYGIKNYCISENEPCNPETEYGRTKYLLCAETESLCKKFAIDYTWARIFSVYGPRDHETTFISYLINTMLKKEIPEVSSCTQLWDYLFIEDAAKALAALINYNGIYNIASGETIALKEVVQNIVKITDYSGEIAWNYKPDSALYYLCGNINKISSDTGWIPIVPISEGLSITYKNILQ